MKNETGVNISNNVFNGIVWDKKAIKAINNVSKALLNLTYLFNNQNIKVDTLLKVENILPTEEDVIKEPNQ